MILSNININLFPLPSAVLRYFFSAHWISSSSVCPFFSVIKLSKKYLVASIVASTLQI